MYLVIKGGMDFQNQGGDCKGSEGGHTPLSPPLDTYEYILVSMFNIVCLITNIVEACGRSSDITFSFRNHLSMYVVLFWKIGKIFLKLFS